MSPLRPQICWFGLTVGVPADSGCFLAFRFRRDAQLSEFFEVQYTAMSNYEERPDDFAADATVLRRRFAQDAEDALPRSSDRLPADSLTVSTQNIWEVIKSQQDLNLPAHKVMVANVRCAQIKDEQLRLFEEDEAWKVSFISWRGSTPTLHLSFIFHCGQNVIL